MTNINTDIVRKEIHELQKGMYVQLGREFGFDKKVSKLRPYKDYHKKYLSTNPDYSPNQIEKYAQQMIDFERTGLYRADLSTLDSADKGSILSSRVDELKHVLESLGYSEKINNICFGTLPGGGLDAFSFKSESTDQYAVVIPEGFFHLTNLICKITILLQPWTDTEQGLVYLPSASFEQTRLINHPYSKFRFKDLFDAYFLHGDPTSALPYSTSIPHQDRLAYLLVGTELFVLAHEVAHVLLGHHDRDDQGFNRTQELEADKLAYEITVEFFRLEGADFAVSRASLCGSLFLSMVRMWEDVLHSVLSTNVDQEHFASHPPFKERLEFFANLVAQDDTHKTPNWYSFVFKAISFATKTIPKLILKDNSSLITLSARVLPNELIHLGNFNDIAEEKWWLTIAKLLTSNVRTDYLLGLWFLLDLDPMAKISLYKGVLHEDEEKSDLFKQALIAIEPMYKDYMPTLNKNLKEAAKDNELEEYIFGVSTWVEGNARFELGKARVELGPISELFSHQMKK